MFYQPILQAGQRIATLCARIPNDVLGDSIQREAGHIFHESGDNYLFMVKSVLEPSIEPGVALSRSRFEDRTFSLGDNLKDGVQTAFGVVRVRNTPSWSSSSMIRPRGNCIRGFAKPFVMAITSMSPIRGILRLPAYSCHWQGDHFFSCPARRIPGA